MQPGDTSFSDETTGVLSFDEWTPTGGPDFFADDQTTTTWISVATTWDDADEATRRQQSQDAANTRGRMAAPQIDWDGDDSTTQTWGHQHIAVLSNAVFRAPARRLDTRAPSEADLASARLRARARANSLSARPAAAFPQSHVPSEAELASARLRARASQPAPQTQHTADAHAAAVLRSSASQRVPRVVDTSAREAFAAATPTLRTRPFAAPAQTQPVASRLTTLRVAPLVALPTNRLEVLPDTWLVPHTQSQLGMMTLVPGVALFAAVLVARVLLATTGASLSSSPMLLDAPTQQAEPVKRTTPIAAQPAPSPPAASPVADVPTAQIAPDIKTPNTKTVRVHHEHVASERVAGALASHHEDDVAPSASQRPVSTGAQGEGVLRINSRPWAEVVVDGALVGHTPQPNLHLSAGVHQVELINRPLGMSKALKVQIRPGQTETQIINLIE